MSFTTLKAADLTPYGPKLLVRKYTLPERIGSILTNPAWRTNNSRALWELVKASESAEELLGMKLPVGTILVTMPNRGVFVNLDESAEHYFIAAAEVLKIIPWTEDGDETP